MLAGPPSHPFAAPVSVLEIAAARPCRAVWQNLLGGLTFEIGEGDGRSYVKWAPAGSGLDLEAEAQRLAWAADFMPVPRVLDRGSDVEGSWIVTAALPGTNAVEPRWLAEPAPAVTAIGKGLRALHDALPVEECPFSWSVESRLAAVRRRVAAGRADPAGWHPEHRLMTLAEALERLERPPAIDRLVVCHGDACAPNTLLAEDGNWSGHVDLGSLGRGDRWADLAVATWSADWNYGPGWQKTLLEAYGIEPDPARISYYRLLWDLE